MLMHACKSTSCTSFAQLSQPAPVRQSRILLKILCPPSVGIHLQGHKKHH